MRLLNKKEIVQKKSNDKRMEIEEGAKLAKKIDVLRETASKEEVKLAKFRKDSLKSLSDEIDELIYRRNKLREEIQILEKKLVDNYK